MALRPQYRELIERLPATKTVAELAKAPPEADAVALRHDVDYDLDLALEMAWLEHRQGQRATYYLLHTAPYWQSDRLGEAARQLQDLGHEVGLHLNVLAEWMRGDIDDVAVRLRELLGELRASGVKVTGTAAHGDPLCYEKQFINYWPLAELRPANPVETETGLSAEGIPAEDETYRIAYPADHRLHRDDGSDVDLWSVRMADLGLTYDASHVEMDRYFTDSGGGWARSPDPAGEDLSAGKHQVLVHPIHWRGPQRIYFFLSTARSGSTWLARVLDLATSATGRHEFSLNHRFDGERLTEDKRTGPQFRELEQQRDTSRQLLIEARRWIETLPGDYAEANVYLERFPHLLEEIFPDALLVHLHRDPRDVVRSIMNRRWYDTPEDRAHPVVNVPGWERLSQFERACWYVRRTNERLLELCDRRLRFERMVEDRPYLAEALEGLGIPLLPRLAEPLYAKKINVARSSEFPPYEQWPAERKKTFHDICDPVNRRLGYDSKPDAHPHQQKEVPRKGLLKRLRDLVGRFRRRSACRRVKVDFAAPGKTPIGVKGARLESRRGALAVEPVGEKHALVTVGAKGWNKRGAGGWTPAARSYYRGKLRAELDEADARVFCLSYDRLGRQMDRRLLGRVRPERPELEFVFKVEPEARRFAIGVYMPVDNLPSELRMIHLEFEAVPLYG